MRYRIGVAPQQYSDGPKQQEQDIRDLFKLSDARNWASMALTEVGPEVALEGLVKKYAEKHEYRVKFMRSNAVLVPRKRIKKNSWTAGEVFVESTKTVEGPGHDSAFAWAGWWDLELDQQVFHAGIHYPTGWYRNENRDTNKRYAGKIQEWGLEKFVNGAIVHVSGDFNMHDEWPDDLFFGGDFRSAGDQLKKHPDTGHGPIDASASWWPDKRVRAVEWNVANDKIFPQHSDHFVDEATYEYKPTKVVTNPMHKCPTCGRWHKPKGQK